MPRVTSSAALNHYNVLLSRHQRSFRCPHCPASLLSKDFQNHCTHRHNLNSKLCCVWCGGRKSWNSGEKYLHSDHMIRCWRKFISRHSPAIPPPISPPPSPSFRPDHVRFDRTLQCREKEFFGHEGAALDTLYQPVWPMPLSPYLPLFEDEGLNLAAECVKLFVQGQFEFFHVTVRVVAFSSFVQALDEDEGGTRTLPFSCLCNGGHWAQLRHRQHRHMIVLAPKGHFYSNVWPKVQVASVDRPAPHVACKDSRGFQNALHFINTLGYLSRRESKCEFSYFEGIEPPSVPAGQFLNHFWIFTSLPKAFHLPLAVQYDHGIQDLLHQDYKNFSIDQLLRLPLVFHQQKWRLKIKYLSGIPLGLVLPVSRNLRPWAPPSPPSTPDTISDSDSEDPAPESRMPASESQVPVSAVPVSESEDAAPVPATEDPVSEVPVSEVPVSEVPVSASEVPVSESEDAAPVPPPTYLHLGDGDVMYFERTQDPEPTPDPDEWLALQVQGGNLFYHAVGEKLFTLRDHHQLLVNATKPTHELYAEQLTENAQLRTENHQLVARNIELVAEMNEKDTVLAQQEAKIAQQDITLARLEMEKRQLVARNIELEDEVARLQQQEAPHKRRKTP